MTYHVILEWFGMMFFAVIVLLIFAEIYWWLKKTIEIARMRYKDRHKFDKPPIAKCYCVACECWIEQPNDKTLGYCNKRRKFTFDNQFCDQAKLRSNETYERQM